MSERERKLLQALKLNEVIAYYPYPETLDQVHLGRHAVIEASAGTGKTYTIEHLVVDRLLKTNARLEQILVVTFTDKATNELRKRIRDLIERILRESERSSLPTEQGDDESEVNAPPPHHWSITINDQRKLERALFSFERPNNTMSALICERLIYV